MLFWGKQLICKPSVKLISSDHRKLRWGWKQERDRKLRYWGPSQACLPSLYNQKQTHISFKKLKAVASLQDANGIKGECRHPTGVLVLPTSAPPWLLESGPGYHWCRQASPPGSNQCSWSPVQTTEGKFTSTRGHWPIPGGRFLEY